MGRNYYKNKNKNELISIIINLQNLLLKQYNYNQKKKNENDYLKTIYINKNYSFPPKYKSWDSSWDSKSI